MSQLLTIIYFPQKKCTSFLYHSGIKYSKYQRKNRHSHHSDSSIPNMERLNTPDSEN